MYRIFEKYQQLKTAKVNKKCQAMIQLLKRYCTAATSYFILSSETPSENGFKKAAG